MHDLFTTENIIASLIFTGTILYIRYKNKSYLQQTNLFNDQSSAENFKDKKCDNPVIEISTQKAKMPYRRLKKYRIPNFGRSY